MRIPIDIDIYFNVGDIIQLIKNFKKEYVLYLCGHKFEIIGKDGYGFIIKDLEFGEVIYRSFYSNYFTKIIDFDVAKSKFIKSKEMKYITSYIERKCPMQTDIYDDREIYTGCSGNGIPNLKGDYNGELYCDPQTACLKYLSDDELQDNKLKIYLRKLKIDKLI